MDGKLRSNISKVAFYILAEMQGCDEWKAEKQYFRGRILTFNSENAGMRWTEG